MVDYKEKIKKLLALSKSPNEHEAQSALAKAQQLMAEHKISMAEVEDKEKRKANEHSAGITYSTRRDPWVLRLSKVISKNYCCESFSRREKGKQTYKLYFCGLNLQVLEPSAYRFVNAVSDFSTHRKPSRGSEYYQENMFMKVVDGDELIDKAYAICDAEV